MKKFLAIVLLVLVIIALAGCGSFSTTKPAIVYQTQEVKVAVPVFVSTPVMEPFQSRVLQLKDNSTDGEVGQSYKQDWLSLMLRDRIFTDFLTQYEKAKTDAQAITK